MESKGSSFLALPTRNSYDEFVTKYDIVNKQRRELQRQVRQDRYPELTDLFWRQAQEFGCVFPNKGDPDGCHKYYQQFDKQKFPPHLVTYFDRLFLWRELREEELYLSGQIWRLRLQACKKGCTVVIDSLCFCKEEVESCFGHLFRRIGGLPSAKGYTKVTT